MAQNKREAILKAAMELFGELGYDGTTMPMIADRAKVGAGTIYRYFENKETLVNLLFQDCVIAFSEILQHDLPQNNQDFQEQFHHLFSRMVEFARNKASALNFIDSHANSHILDDISKSIFNDFMDHIRSYLENGKKHNIIIDMPSDALISIVYGAFSYLYRLIRNGQLKETPELLQNVEECCWKAISKSSEN